MIRSVITIIIFASIIAMSGCSKRTPEQADSNEASYASAPPKEYSNPKYPAVLTCFIGKIGSRSNCSSIIAKPDENVSNFKINNVKLTCGHPGKVSEIGWKFIKHENNKDMYSFKRVFPADANEYTETSKTVAFDENQIIVFQDEYQVIVIDSPDKK